MTLKNAIKACYNSLITSLNKVGIITLSSFLFILSLKFVQQRKYWVGEFYDAAAKVRGITQEVTIYTGSKSFVPVYYL